MAGVQHAANIDCFSPGCCSDENAHNFSCHDINKIRAKDYVTGELVLPWNTLVAHQAQPGTIEFMQCAAVLHFYLNL